jgi:hypothetical protein
MKLESHGTGDLAGMIEAFDVVMTGVPDFETIPLENRSMPLQTAIRSKAVLQHLRVVTQSGYTDDGNAIAKAQDGFGFYMTDDISGQSPAIATPNWFELTRTFNALFAGKSVLVDLTSLSGSAVFQFVRAFHGNPDIKVTYAYTAPKKYPQVENPDSYPPVVTRTIRQPFGYRSFAQEYDQGSRVHVLLLGFDRHRPNKFIEHYQWPLREVRAVLGKPAYVDGGELQAELSIGHIFNELNLNGQVSFVDPKAPQDVMDSLTSIYSGHAVMDIVPLGPKPVLLGTALYWLGLQPEQQERTRILYDFPKLRKQRTEGIGPTWTYSP